MLRYVCLDADTSPVTIELVKDYLKMKVSSDNVVIQLMIDSVTNFAERTTNRCIRAKTWHAFTDTFPVSCWELTRHPVDEVTEIKYSVDGSDTIVATNVYEIKQKAYYTNLLLSTGKVWPTDSDVKSDAVRISFATKADRRSEEIVLAILKHIAYAFENRGDDEQIINEAVFRESRFYRSVTIPQF